MRKILSGLAVAGLLLIAACTGAPAFAQGMQGFTPATQSLALPAPTAN